MQLVTRTGTNSVHGDVYEYFRDSALNANDPNLKAVGLVRPVLHQNIYGMTLGGPIRKNRAFFFGSYQGTRAANGATEQSLYKSVLIADGLTDDRSETTLLNNFQSVLPVGTSSIDPTALALLNAKLPDGKHCFEGLVAINCAHVTIDVGGLRIPEEAALKALNNISDPDLKLVSQVAAANKALGVSAGMSTVMLKKKSVSWARYFSET